MYFPNKMFLIKQKYKILVKSQEMLFLTYSN